jgi:hypothetical protein
MDTRLRRTKASLMGSTVGRLTVMPSKNGGFLMYVEVLSHGYRSPDGASSLFQRSLPEKPEASFLKLQSTNYKKLGCFKR